MMDDYTTGKADKRNEAYWYDESPAALQNI